MNCSRHRESLALIASGCATSLSAEAQQHLDSCESCQAALRDWQQLSQILTTPQSEEPQAATLTRIHARLEAALAEPPASTGWPRWVWAIPALAALAFLPLASREEPPPAAPPFTMASYLPVLSSPEKLDALLSQQAALATPDFPPLDLRSPHL